MSRLRTMAVLGFLAPYAILAAALGYPIARLLRSPGLLYALGRFGARTACRLAGIRVTFEGLEHLRDPRNLVLLPNHVSHLDAAILFGLIPLPIKAVVKKELYDFPFVHYCMRYAGFIEVDRRDPNRSKTAVARAVAALKTGSCFMIFPEGTRSRTGELGEFKKGAFAVAIEAGSRIVPVAIVGAEALMPPGRLVIEPGTVRVRVLDPVDAASYSTRDRDRLVEEVRGRIAAALPQRGAPPPGAGGGEGDGRA
jgi:1-acyl-sn-glycerol-3-phosphate acyltransferase